MQQLSNDTYTWSLIDSPLAAPLSYNSNVYDSLAHSDAVFNNFNNQIAPIKTDTFGPASAVVETNSANYWAFALVFFPLFTIFGNVLVVISVYREKSLHTVTNYFVVSLAISDITVAAVVMPFSIYLEFNRVWELSERLCDFWVASDCMACTASILNLVAIAVDRYIAVTKPLEYSRHKNPKRVAIMIVVVWLISFLIALPIVSGVNKSDVADYPRTSDQCAFFNNKFLIFSSLGSFFIPCIIIFAIYYRIFMVIMARAKHNRKQLRPKVAIQTAAAQHRSNANQLVTSFLQDRQELNVSTTVNEDTNHNPPVTPQKNSIGKSDGMPLRKNNHRNSIMLQLSTPVLSPAMCTSINLTSSSADQIDDDEQDDVSLFVHHQQQENNSNKLVDDQNFELSPIQKKMSIIKFDQTIHMKQIDPSLHTENHQNSTKNFKIRLKQDDISNQTLSASNTTQTNKTKTAKRKVYSRMKKERKATQTLIIVLICFLVCWLPFFVLNNLVNAIFKLSKKSNELLISDFVLSLCIWLGYTNSFLNPIIYTIFNLEFRKAFAKILFSSCRSSNYSSS